MYVHTVKGGDESHTSWDNVAALNKHILPTLHRSRVPVAGARTPSDVACDERESNKLRRFMHAGSASAVRTELCRGESYVSRLSIHSPDWMLRAEGSSVIAMAETFRAGAEELVINNSSGDLSPDLELSPSEFGPNSIILHHRSARLVVTHRTQRFAMLIDGGFVCTGRIPTGNWSHSSARAPATSQMRFQLVALQTFEFSSLQLILCASCCFRTF